MNPKKRLTSDELSKKIADIARVKKELGIPLTEYDRMIEDFNWRNKAHNYAQQFGHNRDINNLSTQIAKLKGPANPRHEEYINLYINTQQNEPRYRRIKDHHQRESTMRLDAQDMIRKAEAEAAQAQAKRPSQPFQYNNNQQRQTNQQPFQQQFQYPQLSIYPQNQQPFQYNNQHTTTAETKPANISATTTNNGKQTSNNSSNNSNTHNYQYTHKTSNHSNTTTTNNGKQTSNHFKPPEENNQTNTHIQNAIKLLKHLLQKNEIFAQLSSEQILKFYIKSQSQRGYKRKMAKNNHDKSLSRFSNAIQKESLDLGITWSNSGERHNSRGLRTKSMIDYVGGEDKLRRIVDYVKNQTGRGK